MKSCFFIGRSETSSEVQKLLTEAVKRHIREHGITEFIISGHGQFDFTAAEVVMNAKQKYPYIMLSIILPHTPEKQQLKFTQGYDKIYQPSSVDKAPRWYAMVKLHRSIIDQSKHLIIYNWQFTSNTRELVKYAQEREKIGLLQIEELKG